MYHKPTSNASVIQEAISYTLPELYTGKEWYVGFYAYDPLRGKLRRKKIKLNFIKSITQRRKRAKDLIYALSCKLDNGWNPWIEQLSKGEMTTWDEACIKFRNTHQRMYEDGLLEIDSLKTLKSQLNVLTKYNLTRKVPMKYVYQFNKELINDFLDYQYMDKGVTPRTRDNYLGFCRKLSGYFVEKGLLNNRPDEGIKVFGKKARKKRRTIIEACDMAKLIAYLEKENPHYLLACYLVYYCCIRPKELSYLQLKHINVMEQTIFIPENISKNDKNGIVTLPESIIHLMINLKIFDHPSRSFLFSDSFKPGDNHVDRQHFRRFWDKRVRPALDFPDHYVFYSLKDTGITNMLQSNLDPLTVRDQARHQSIEMTNTYTPAASLKAQDALKKYSSF